MFPRLLKHALVLAPLLTTLVAIPTPARAVAPGGNLCDLGPRSTVTAGADLIIGTAGNDVLRGGDGDDTILGCGGNDTLDGQSGTDLLIGGEGDDTVDGAAGDDLFYAGEFRTWDRYFDPPIPLLQGKPNTVSIDVTVDPMEMRTFIVRLDIVHASPSDLKIKLLTPLVSSSTGLPRTVVLTDKNCVGPSSTTNMCGPGQFHSKTSPEVGVTFTSDAATSIQHSGAKGFKLNGIFHPRGTLDGGFRFKNSCTGTDCTYTLQFTDLVSNGIKGKIKYVGIDIEGPSAPDGQDVFIGGGGHGDLASYVSRNTSLTYNGEDNLANDGEAGENDNVMNDIEWFYGGLGNDTLIGTNNTHGGWNDIRGYEGNDTEYGLAGDDRLDYHGDHGADMLYGGEGDDELVGDDAPPPLDYEDGGPGTDTCLYPLTWVDCELFA